MKCQSLIIIATVIIVSAVAFAGCVEEETFEPPVAPTPVVSPTVTPTGAPTATPAPTVTPTTTPTPTEGDYRVEVSLSKMMMEDITITLVFAPWDGYHDFDYYLNPNPFRDLLRGDLEEAFDD